MEKTNNTLVGILAVLVMILVGVGCYAYGSSQVAPVNNVTDTIVVFDNATAEKVDALTLKVNSLDEFTNKVDEIVQNDTAKALVLAEMAKRDFIKDVLAIIEADKSVDSYKDLTIDSIKIEDVELDDESATVTVVFKVDGFEDNDEESDFRARLSATFEVEGLDVDDMDAEIADTEITLEKFYD